ncbi:hypothetical protein FHS82_000911 [Pseudochelatococcus lubricantis]|uniref:Uncharacterized protein n=1 Tax=Pseudochelatococcus lubricantis TaxID=1538102 RepID=A0ABX0UZS4_9HYPH|nr:hypothetical protein [Pseudochelatococcus lubricantis]
MSHGLRFATVLRRPQRRAVPGAVPAHFYPGG